MNLDLNLVILFCCIGNLLAILIVVVVLLHTFFILCFSSHAISGKRAKWKTVQSVKAREKPRWSGKVETDVTSEKRGKARKAKYMTDEKRVKNKNMYS